MTDDLLDEATRLADSEWPPAALTIPVLRALVERVRAAEDRLDSATDAYDGWRNKALDLRSDLDEARGKLDKVRALAESMQRAKVGGGFLSGSINTADVLDILDEE
jgi:hypothetical protein